ncbi:MAG: aminodeoxychorismate synthase component I [Gemmatimonadetes bacterium]|nr:aminodeoxychorismate synthase component I [Gemmatimonadota bacterium]
MQDPTVTPVSVRLDALTEHGTERSFVFEQLVDIICVTQVDEVIEGLTRIEAAVAGGLHAAGYISYEAAPGLDPALATGDCPDGFPLLWFGLFRRRRTVQALEGIEVPPMPLTAWLSQWSGAVHAERVARIRQLIAAGDTYQVNLTMRQRATFDGDVEGLYHALCLAQPTALCALVDTGPFAICSASPELHFALCNGELIARPMKGTRPRGRWVEEDAALAEELSVSSKERAENTMIVDLLRNDLGRVSATGSVGVEQLWQVEQYPTVWQMTSTIRSQLHPDTTLPSLMRALFPCGSVTGAPKVRTMQIIKELEDSPRGIYTGSIGYLSPREISDTSARPVTDRPQASSGLAGVEARFSVAIRTVCVDRRRRQAVAGIGGGITWDSTAAAEYEECLTKARFLSQPVPVAFELLETMRWAPDEGIWLLDRHLERLRQSASYFDFAFDHRMVMSRLQQATVSGVDPMRLRLTLARQGTCRVECARLDSPANVTWSAALAREPVDSEDVFLFHKTTNRRTYDQASSSVGEDVDEAVLFNERGELTETVRGNLVVIIDGRRLTPPVASGLLPGTYRAQLLAQGEIEESVLRIDDLFEATSLYSINSLRRWIRLDLRLSEARHDLRAS